ncbi:MAG: hypothetical protein WBQ36_08865 [Desulfobaccales bacterium]
MNNSARVDISACSRKNLVNQRLATASMWVRLMLFSLFSIGGVMVFSSTQPASP